MKKPVSEEALLALAESQPDLVAKYRASIVGPDQEVQQARDFQDYGSIVNGVGNLANDYSNSQKSQVVLHNRMQDLGSTPSIKAPELSKYDSSGLDAATDRNLSRAKEGRQAAEAGFWNTEKLKDRQQGLADSALGREDASLDRADAAGVRAAKVRSNDPASSESAAARSYLQQLIPGSDKQPGFEGLTEVQAYRIAPGLLDRYKLDETIAGRKSDTAQRSADRNALVEGRRIDRADARASKEADYQAGIRVDGATVKDGFRPTADDAKKAKAAKDAYSKITLALDEMDIIHKRSGTNLVGDDATAMDSLKTVILMSQKELDKLGVLSGNDETLTLNQVPDPTSLTENAKGAAGLEQYGAKSKQYRKNLDNQFDSTLGATGYNRDVSRARARAGAGAGAGSTTKKIKHGSDLP